MRKIAINALLGAAMKCSWLNVS